MACLMLDFAKPPSAKRSKKRGLYQRFRNFVKKLLRFVRLFLIGLLAAAGLAVILIFTFPFFVNYDLNRNIIFYQADNQNKIQKVWFAALKADKMEVEVYPLVSNFQSQILQQEAGQIEQQALSGLLEQLPVQTFSQQPAWTWISGRVIHDVISFPADINIENERDLAQYLQPKFEDWLNPGLLLTDWSFFKLKLWTKRAEWRFFDAGTQLPQTSVLSDGCTVALINTTPITGFASTITSILESSGARVIRLDSETLPESKTTVYFDRDEPECGTMTDLLSTAVFPQEVAVNPNEQMNQELRNRYRADLIILLGKGQGF